MAKRNRLGACGQTGPGLVASRNAAPGFYTVRRFEALVADGRRREWNTAENVDAVLPVAAKLSAGDLDLHT
jgi:hypothetical protein